MLFTLNFAGIYSNRQSYTFICILVWYVRLVNIYRQSFFAQRKCPFQLWNRIRNRKSSACLLKKFHVLSKKFLLWEKNSVFIRRSRYFTIKQRKRTYLGSSYKCMEGKLCKNINRSIFSLVFDLTFTIFRACIFDIVTQRNFWFVCDFPPFKYVHFTHVYRAMYSMDVVHSMKWVHMTVCQWAPCHLVHPRACCEF